MILSVCYVSTSIVFFSKKVFFSTPRCVLTCCTASGTVAIAYALEERTVFDSEARCSLVASREARVFFTFLSFSSSRICLADKNPKYSENHNENRQTMFFFSKRLPAARIGRLRKQAPSRRRGLSLIPAATSIDFLDFFQQAGIKAESPRKCRHQWAPCTLTLPLLESHVWILSESAWNIRVYRASAPMESAH